VDLPADTFPGYDLIEELGRGSTGTVFKAWATQINKPVALKVLRPTQETDSSVRAQRFLREARFMAYLSVTESNPNIPRVYAVDQQQAHVYYVREFVDGNTLANIAKRGSLRLEQGIAILATVAGTIERVHQVGHVHRNLDPANVLIAVNGAVKLIGFGRMRLLAGSEMDPTGTYGAPLKVDLKGLQQMLNWLCSILQKSIPPVLAAAWSSGALRSAAGFAELLRSWAEGQPQGKWWQFWKR
jgi:serine/threonine protein kinase